MCEWLRVYIDKCKVLDFGGVLVVRKEKKNRLWLWLRVKGFVERVGRGEENGRTGGFSVVYVKGFFFRLY